MRATVMNEYKMTNNATLEIGVNQSDLRNRKMSSVDGNQTQMTWRDSNHISSGDRQVQDV